MSFPSQTRIRDEIETAQIFAHSVGCNMNVFYDPDTDELLGLEDDGLDEILNHSDLILIATVDQSGFALAVDYPEATDPALMSPEDYLDYVLGNDPPFIDYTPSPEALADLGRRLESS